MKKFQQEIALLKESEQKISDYNQVLENVQSYILARLQHNEPLPHDLTNILSEEIQSDEGLENIINETEAVKISNSEYLKLIRENLGKSNVTMAVYWIVNWSSNIGHELENVINEYKRSNIFPAPHQHFSGMMDRIADLLPVEKHESMSNYLRTSENPWAKYVTKLK